MTTPRDPLRSWRRRRPRLAAAPALVLGLFLSACGGSAPAASVATKQACQQVAGALADGPDSDADPAGYAEAQIVPLSRIHTSDRALKKAIGQLDTAYRQLFASDGQSSAAVRAAVAASRKVNAICPGATS